MMLIYGKRNSIKKGPLMTFRCNHCGLNNEHATAHVLRYFHFFWLPLFPTSSCYASTCLHCKFGQSSKENYSLKDTIGLNFKRNFPWWAFSGLILFCGLILYTKLKSEF